MHREMNDLRVDLDRERVKVKALEMRNQYLAGELTKAWGN